MDYFWEKLVFQKSSLLKTRYYDVTISGKECFTNWNGLSNWHKFCTVEFPFQIAFKQDQNIDR